MKLTLLAVTLATLAPCLAAPAYNASVTSLEKRQVSCRTISPAVTPVPFDPAAHRCAFHTEPSGAYPRAEEDNMLTGVPSRAINVSMADVTMGAITGYRVEGNGEGAARGARRNGVPCKFGQVSIHQVASLILDPSALLVILPWYPNKSMASIVSSAYDADSAHLL
ncbi:hypothetical protein MBM_03470 [Drepanopeziza brunnea f. sp. 'multigermtubi' MB_m1]|uniref:Uncharacterized protein n=1 Tax=Marssonina brunnea f. sp. multigermtubi (strain MB_m1) TaxID=1072389 RepID=K1X0G2_MARBU|nr:uncharacterized protein MBM_03470 [Drepanopeziza brunnea f. sp. 'multigermtubi' MB_m1]EKD18477.1 hypothetical protein MBM_03470 [Drepanopeziza brunnea f. sp. 'multigermtubi' MB_m1]